MGRALVIVIVAAGCGRVGFDEAARDPTPDGGVAAGRIAYFRFDDDPARPRDEVAGRFGTCANTTCPTQVAGQFGKAVQFDGVDDCLQVTPPTFSPQRFTISLWANQTDTGPMTFVSQPYFVTDLTGNSWEVEAGFNLDFTLTVLHGAIAQTSETISGQILLGSWYHVAFTWDGQAQRIYVGGSLAREDPAASTGTVPYDGTPWFIGCDNNTMTVQPTAGALDELAIYDRALSAAEIAELARP